MAKKPDPIERTKELMGVLVRMKPKPHEEMRVGKKKSRKSKGAATVKRVPKKTKPSI
jgi:hypothetical protein